ncbi:hypothetical protein M3924_002988 [Vibrio fluvialis]|nr:hypothetical protein [Vibrio fluvialis]
MFVNKIIKNLTRNESEALILTVCNNPKIPKFGGKFLYSDNRSWEFSAWDDGVEYLNKNNLVNDDSIIIFLNDTFCFHRDFNVYNVLKLTRKIKKNDLSSKVIGDVCHKKNTEFNINGTKISWWISTYLFSTSIGVVNKIGKLDMVSQINLKPNKYIDFENRTIKIEGFCESFNTHLTNWLFPESPSQGWYNASVEDKDLIVNKLKAILNEMLFSVEIKRLSINPIELYNNIDKKAVRAISIFFNGTTFKI